MKKSYAKYFRRYIWLIIPVTILRLSATLGNLYAISMTSQLIDELSNHNASHIENTAVILFFVESISLVLEFLAEKLILKVKASVVRNLHSDLASALARASSETVSEMDSASLSERLREGFKFVDSVCGIYDEIFSCIAGIIALAYAFAKSLPIAILFVVSIIIILSFQVKAIQRMSKKAQEAAKASDNTRQLLIEIIDAFSAIKSQDLIGGLKPHFSQKLDNECLLNSDYESVHISTKSISSEMLTLSKFAFIFLGSWLATYGYLAFSDFVALFMYKSKVDGIVGAIMHMARNISSISTSTKRMDDVLNYQKISKEVFGSNKLPHPSGNLSIRNICAKYGNTAVLSNISIDLPAGKFIGVVGHSGCGKSTLLKILARQQTPVSGKISIDGFDIYSLNEWSYHKAITFAPQTPYLFTLSIRENLTLGNHDVSDCAIWNALEECAAAEFVRSKGGLDVILSPKELSGGEQQRLSLARLGIKGAKIILMDESTSALDGKSQNVVIETIKEAVKRGHTILLVAHRLSTLKDADMIIHLEDGQILETGTFSELYKNSDKFRRLADLS